MSYEEITENHPDNFTIRTTVDAMGVTSVLTIPSASSNIFKCRFKNRAGESEEFFAVEETTADNRWIMISIVVNILFVMFILVGILCNRFYQEKVG